MTLKKSESHLHPADSPDAADSPVAADFRTTLHAELRQQIGERNFRHWFLGKTTIDVDQNVLRIGVGSPFLLNWMQKQFKSSLNRAAATILGPSGIAQLHVDGSIALQTKAGPESAPNTSLDLQTAVMQVTGQPQPRPQTDPKSLSITPSVRKAARRRFSSLTDFVVGTCNELAFTAARQVCETPGDLLNPLYIHGNAGTGKTHLLEGIYGCIRRQYPEMQVMYLTSESFTNYFTQALRDRSLPGFRQRFRSIDVLLVDDVDFLDAKRGIGEEFLHTITQLESHGQQVVVTSDCHPRLLTRLSDDLTTRFLSGLVCRLEPPDLETRRRIVRCRATKLQGDITTDALDFVARRFAGNVRELEGALNCLDTWSRLKKSRITLSTARTLLADLERDCIRIVNIADIEKTVCRVFGVSGRDLKSTGRQKSLSQPRMLAMYLARKHTQAAYSEIGQYFGKRNHSTVIAAEKRVRGWLENGESVRIATQSWPLAELMQTMEEQLLVG